MLIIYILGAPHLCASRTNPWRVLKIWTDSTGDRFKLVFNKFRCVIYLIWERTIIAKIVNSSIIMIFFWPISFYSILLSSVLFYYIILYSISFYSKPGFHFFPKPKFLDFSDQTFTFSLTFSTFFSSHKVITFAIFRYKNYKSFKSSSFSNFTFFGKKEKKLFYQSEEIK